jgi:hypothetical protein
MITLRMAKPGRKGKNGRKKERLLKNKKQRQTLSNWRKTFQYLLKREQALVMENAIRRGSYFFFKYEVTNARFLCHLSPYILAQLTETWN